MLQKASFSSHLLSPWLKKIFSDHLLRCLNSTHAIVKCWPHFDRCSLKAAPGVTIWLYRHTCRTFLAVFWLIFHTAPRKLFLAHQHLVEKGHAFQMGLTFRHLEYTRRFYISNINGAAGENDQDLPLSITTCIKISETRNEKNLYHQNSIY